MRDMIRDALVDLLPLLLLALGELLRRKLGLEKDSQAAQAINLAVARAGARVYEMMAAQGVPLSDQAAINRITAQAALEAGGRVSNALGRRGVGEAEFKAMVRGEFAGRIAADPNITISSTKE